MPATSEAQRCAMYAAAKGTVVAAASHARRIKAGREKVRYKISPGWYDPAVKRFIRPGEEPGCRCVGKPVIKGFS